MTTELRPRPWWTRTPLRFPATSRYVEVGELGRGGTGVVFRAHDRMLDHEVALKVLYARDAQTIARLKAEFRARADLHHPNLVQLFDLVISDNVAFFTMEVIDGSDLLSWLYGSIHPLAVHADQAARLATTMRTIVQALRALHDAGLVHNDVKPDNILIDRQGRPFLADFGISTRHQRDAGAPSAIAERSGTPSYMAPERRTGHASPASDLYSVGITLAEALLGAPQAPAAGAGLDPAYDELVTALCASEPAARPTSDAVIVALERIAAGSLARDRDTAPICATAEPARGGEFFVGRTAELAQLRDHFVPLDETTGAVVHVRGPSGIGKTALLRRFVTELAEIHTDLLVLRGRCHLHEQIAFAGVDRVIDGLADHLQTAAIDLGGLPAAGRAGLATIFPALAGVLHSDGAPPAERGADEQRRTALATLRELMLRVTAERRTVIWIDDTQWIDDDSLDVIVNLLGTTGLPRCLFVLVYRVDQHSIARQLVTTRCDAVIDVPPLASEQSEQLLRHLLPPGANATELHRIAQATNGYPVFAQLFTRRSQLAALTEYTAPDLDTRMAALINGVVDQLPATERALFDAIAVAPGPVALTVASLAAGVSAHGLAALRSLEQQNLIVPSLARDAMRVLPFHDRLRQARLRGLAPASLDALHRGLAAAHEQLATGDLNALIHHHEQLGHHDRAASYAVEAGDRAAATLAFASAASHYVRALDWQGERAPRRELLRKLAECEANLGHGEDAGRYFEQAARHDHDNVTAQAELRLQLRAAEQYLRCGCTAAGYAHLRDVLAALGVRVPGSRGAAIVASATQRVQLLLRGTKFTPQPEAELDDEQRLRLDALWTATTGLAHLNFALSDVMISRHCLAALRAGAPARVLHSLAFEAAAERTLGGGFFARRSAAILARASSLLDTTSSHYDHGWYWASCAATNLFSGAWPDVVTCAARAEQHLLTHGHGVAWERAVLSSYWLFALALTCQVDALAHRRQIALEDACARRDALSEHQCRTGYAAMLWLYRDEPAIARSEAEQMANSGLHHDSEAAPRAWPQDGFGTPDYHALLADAHRLLYSGDPAGACIRVERAWSHVQRALLLRIQFIGVDLRFLRARCAIAARHYLLRTGAGHLEAGRRLDPRGLERIARQELNAIRRDANPTARPYSALIAGLLGDAPLRHLAQAAAGFDRLSMRAHAAATRARLAELADGSADGAAKPLLADIHAELSALGVVAPPRIIALFAPAASDTGMFTACAPSFPALCHAAAGPDRATCRERVRSPF